MQLLLKAVQQKSRIQNDNDWKRNLKRKAVVEAISMSPRRSAAAFCLTAPSPPAKPVARALPAFIPHLYVDPGFLLAHRLAKVSLC